MAEETPNNGAPREPNIKVARAIKHLAELEELASTFLATKPAKWECRLVDEADGNTHIHYQFKMDGVPEEISAVIGDIIHNLRAALDLMASEMARKTSGDDKDVYFPFSNSPGEMDNMIQRRRFHLAGPDAVALLKQFEPYKGGNIYLRAIHDLDIQDKHQSIIPGTMTSAGPIIRLDRGPNGIQPVIHSDPNAASETFLIFPEKGPLGGKPLIQTLHDLVELTDGVIEAFAALIAART